MFSIIFRGERGLVANHYAIQAVPFPPDSDFGRYRLQFNTLLDHDAPEAFTGGAPELCNQMKHIAGRLTVEAATESSIELSRSAGDLPFWEQLAE